MTPESWGFHTITIGAVVVEMGIATPATTVETEKTRPVATASANFPAAILALDEAEGNLKRRSS